MSHANAVVDAHQHFWNPSDDSEAYSWLSGDLAALNRPFTPADLAPDLEDAGVTGTVLVQTRSSFEESRQFLALAAVTPFIRGVVAWLDLTADDVTERIDELRGGEGGGRLVGIRHQVHDEPDAAWLNRPAVRRGLASVERAGLVYDLLVRTRELPAALETCRAMPSLRFVIDHLAKPPIASGELSPWAELMAPFGELANVSCKLSGMVTEARTHDWSVTDLRPYAQYVLDVSGPDRIMYGSDWPVCLAAAPYGRVIGATRQLIEGLSMAEQAAVMGGTAEHVYVLG
jgi:L-fuconolactonase